ncbi:unnamed protein product [marine sediment metagenome]|uniref:Uncharacterized protein n=1 Tax=marine sediment metagenome TaxID=412755 RepID=X1UTX4_9ZZZZ
MFNIKVKHADEKQARINMLIYVDTLHEAEILTLKYLQRLYDSRYIKIAHEHDLIYNIYIGSTLIGTVAITLGD